MGMIFYARPLSDDQLTAVHADSSVAEALLRGADLDEADADIDEDS